MSDTEKIISKLSDLSINKPKDEKTGMCMVEKLLTIKNKLTHSKYQTKDWRKNQSWYIDGRHNECEKEQRKCIEEITEIECLKSNGLRINMDTIEIKKNTSPMTKLDAFDWTEDFDGIQEYNNNKIYYNLKMVCDSGGAQTRTLREVAHFITYQLKYNLKHKEKPIYFVNILDGDCSYKYKHLFQYLLENEKYSNIKKYFYVGCLRDFVKWWYKINHII